MQRSNRWLVRFFAFVYAVIAAVSICGASGVGSSALAQGPAGWKLILRVKPNPLPVGRCAGVEIELQDPDGFRTGSMANGQSLDQRQFIFTSSNATSFSWRDNSPTGGVVCTTASAPPGRTTIRVVLPDGVAGETVLTSLAPGQNGTAVVYPPQGKLRPPGYVSGAPAAGANATPGATSGAAAPQAAPGTGTPTVATVTPNAAAPAKPAPSPASSSSNGTAAASGTTSNKVRPIQIYPAPIHAVGDCPTAASCPP